MLRILNRLFKPKREIDYILVKGYPKKYKPIKKGEHVVPAGHHDHSWEDECSIKHIGNQIYLIGYYEPYKTGEYRSSFGQNFINKYMLLFPNQINEVHFK